MTSVAMYAVLLVTWLFIGTSLCRDQSIVIKSDVCDQEYTLGDEDDLIWVYYYGASFDDSTCKITIKTNDGMKDICSYPKKFELQSCVATIQYHAFYYSLFSPDREYTCSSKQYSEYCTTSSQLTIAVDRSGSSSFGRSDSVELKVSLKDNSGIQQIVDASKVAVVVIVGVVVGVIVILIILVVVVVACCCRRRPNQAGTVYRAPGQTGAVTTTVGYPMANQAGYQPQAGYGQPGFQQPPTAGFQQPPPAGFQQPPPGGYQQPPPAGFQQQPGGYPPVAQQGYAGYQTGPAPFTDKSSAPPMEPPPYSS